MRAAESPACSSVSPDNRYTEMQRAYYETTADLMNETNHAIHNENPDYWSILVGDTEQGFEDKVGLDFGCGCGRNVMNLWPRFRRMEGVDLAAANLAHAERNLLAAGASSDRFALHQANGVDLSGLPSHEYDFLMSTIVLQHICVYTIRLQYLREFFRVVRPGALLSIQMGFGPGPQGKAQYLDDHWDALGTNSLHDVTVTDPEQLRGDLVDRIGFEDFRYAVRPAFDDGHPLWIYAKARKPA